jgi:8-oxo-dGTP diphosphatase
MTGTDPLRQPATRGRSEPNVVDPLRAAVSGLTSSAGSEERATEQRRREDIARQPATRERSEPHVIVVGTAIVRDGNVLAQQRAYPARDAGRWELPGGRVEPGESELDAVVRECLEELGIRVRVGGRVGGDVPLREGLVLRVYAAAPEPPDAEPHPHDHQALRWLSESELDNVDWLPADRVLLPALRSLLCSVPDPGQPQR